PSTTMPPGDTVYRARSCSRSTPICVPSGTTTNLSRIALRTTACRPISTPSISTEPSTWAHECTRTSGPTTLFSTSEPEMTAPGDTIEPTARPTRPSTPCTNFAGGNGRFSV